MYLSNQGDRIENDLPETPETPRGRGEEIPDRRTLCEHYQTILRRKVNSLEPAKLRTENTNYNVVATVFWWCHLPGG